MTRDEERTALLRAVIAEPDDDLPRLAFADWCEEYARTERVPCPTCSRYADEPCPQCDGAGWHNEMGPNTFPRTCPICEGAGEFPPGYHPERDVGSGRREGGWTNCKTCNGGANPAAPGFVLRSDGLAERAEFIRVQVALASRDRWIDRGGRVRYSVAPPAFRTDEYERLMGRQRDLFTWQNLNLWGFRSPAWQRTTTDRKEFDAFDDPVGMAFVRRGFVTEVRAPLRALLEHGAAALRAHPVRKMIVICRTPCNRCGGVGYHWHPYGPLSCDLPSRLWRRKHKALMAAFPSAEAALETLNGAVLRECREDAGLEVPVAE